MLLTLEQGWSEYFTTSIQEQICEWRYGCVIFYSLHFVANTASSFHRLQYGRAWRRYKHFIVCGCTGGSEQQEEQRYQGIYHTHLVNRDQKSYTPRIECEVDWTTCKSLSFCSRLSVRQLILQCGRSSLVCISDLSQNPKQAEDGYEL